MQEFLPLANRLADLARKIVHEYYRQGFDIERKGDASPVTIADRKIEEAMRDHLEKERPQDGILGEEFGTKPSASGLTWVLDPIDGTKSFMIGRPTFGTLIALCDDDKPALGILDQGILEERWVGMTGMPSTLNAAPIQTRRCGSLKDAVIGSTTPAMFKRTGPVYEKFEQTGHNMVWGGDCYMYGLLSCGYMDMTIEASLSPYDFAALVPIVEGAGGQICDYQGNRPNLNSDGSIIAMGDPNLWPEIQNVLDS